MQDLPRGGGNYFLGGRGLATRCVAMRLLGGLGACFPEKFLGMVRFGAYFHKFFYFQKVCPQSTDNIY